MDEELRADEAVREQAPQPRMEGVVNLEPLPIPMALREQEISEKDFETLMRIAEDPHAASGRLKKVPRKIPIRNRDAVNS